jgi:hypothetical protein
MITKKLKSVITAALVCAAGSVAVPTAQAAIADNLVVHLTFDNTFNDASGRNNHGTPVVQPEVDTGLPVTVTDGALVGTHALRLLAGQHVNLGQPADLQFGESTDFSISFWIKGDTAAWTSDPSFIGTKNWASGGNLGYIIAAQGNGGWKWNFTGNAAGRLDTPNLGVIRDNTWHNIVVTHERTGLARFYVDGVEVATSNIAGTGSIDSGLDTNIGNDGTGRYGFDNDTGARIAELYLDDVGIWRRSLNAAEAATIYGAGLQGMNLAQADMVPLAVNRIFPLAGSTDAPAVGQVFAEITNVDGTLDPASVRFFFDDAEVDAQLTTLGDVTRVAYLLPEALAAGSTHTARVEAADSSTPPRTIVQEWTFTVAQYQTLPEFYALPAGSATTPGIRFRTVEAIELWQTGTTLPNSIARAEAQLAGTLINPNTGEPFTNGAEPGPNPDESFTVPVVNFEQQGQDAGRIGGDSAFPGLDNPPDDYNNFSTEALAYLDLAAGYYRFGVNSDDGFQLRAGRPARSVLDSVVLGAFNDGRGAADSVFDFVAPVDGIYPFRLIHFEGGGGASLEWWSVDLETGDRILINDTTNPNSVRSFAFAADVDALPYVRSVTPLPGENFARPDDPIRAEIVAGTTALPAGSIRMELDGTPVTPTTSTQDGVTTVTYLPSPPLEFRTLYTVTLAFGTGASEVVNEWQFTTRGFDQPPGITGHWNFEGNLQALIGAEITYPNEATRSITAFGSSEDFDIPGIGGQPAQVMFFPGAATDELYFTVPHGAAPNADGIRVNRWTVIMDLFFPESNTQTWFSFMQIDDLTNKNDGELFANFSDRTGDGIPDGGIGIGGQYTNVEDGLTYIRRGQWHRVVFAIDQTNDNEFEQGVLSKFIDGIKFQDQLRGDTYDGRHALRQVFLLFADENGETQPVYISSLQVRNYKMTDAEVAALGGVTSAGGISTVTGQWNFTDGNLGATLGTALEYRGDIGAATSFPTDTIGGQSARVMSFPAATQAQGYSITPGAMPNGGGDFVNQYTLLLDLKFPADSTGKWRGLWQTDTNNITDGDLFINTANGIGIAGNYSGTIAADTWHRVAFALDLTRSELAKYIDGQHVGTQTLSQGVDGRWSVGDRALLFTDEDGETAAGRVSSIQFRPFQLSAEQIAALGAPSAAGIPLDLPYVETITMPDLALERLPSGQVRIAWEAGSGLILEQSPTVTPEDWSAVPGVTGNSATLDVTGSANFLRLRR